MDEPVEHLIPYDWSADGVTLFVQARFADRGRDIGTVTLEGGAGWEPLMQASNEDWSPALSPDGRWLAYSSTEPGLNEVYIRRYPELDGRLQVSVGGGFRPTWSRDGREIAYQQSALGGIPDAMVSVELDIDADDPSASTASPPERLFTWRHFGESGGRRYLDVSPADERFLALTTGGVGGDTAEPPEIAVVVNWFEELKARVPVP